MAVFRTKWMKLAAATLSVLMIGEIAARLSGDAPAYLSAGRIRRSCGCRELRVTHAPAGMDTSVMICVNRLGLRGRLPEEGEVRIITLGNSTTECAYIDDAATWPHLLQEKLNAQGRAVWVGNGGVNGTSTRGNAIFLEDHLLGLHPDIVIFMPGAADRGRISAKQDAGLLAPEHLAPSQWLLEHSLLVGSTARFIQAREPRTMDWSTIGATATSPDTSRMRGSRVPVADHDAFVLDYAERIAHVADLCAVRDVRLLLMTQPILAEDSSDTRRIMERYNDATKSLALERGIPLFDLASTMAQDKGYYLDGIHFSNDGAKEVARLVTPFVDENAAWSKN
jgi:lysophospholipase L1-like esterase